MSDDEDNTVDIETVDESTMPVTRTKNKVR